MAAVAAIRTYLREVIGLGADATGTERANAIIDEGLASFDAFQNFAKADIKALCSSVRKPGGMIDDPNHNGVGDPRQIPNPGSRIPALCETKLIAAAYGAQLYEQIGRQPDALNLSATRLVAFRRHLETVESHDDPKSFPQIGKTFGIMKMLEQFPTFLEEKLGVNGIALAYVIRENAVRPGVLPAQDRNVPWSQPHLSMSEELIAYASHEGPGYQTDNATVYRILQEILGDSIHMSSIKPMQRRRDGRAAFQALNLHNMGNSKWDKVVEQAEMLVNRRIWDGKNSRYSLKNHITRHREAHNDFVRAGQHIPYAEPGEHTRVRRLLHSIQSKDAVIISAKTTIQADAAKQNDFELASDFLLLMAPLPTPNARHHNVSGVHGSDDKKKTFKKKTETRYYKADEWRRLSHDEKKKVLEQRGNRGGGESGPAKKAKYEDRISALETKLLEAQQQISAARTETPLPPVPPARGPLNPPAGLNQR